MNFYYEMSSGKPGLFFCCVGWVGVKVHGNEVGRQIEWEKFLMVGWLS